MSIVRFSAVLVLVAAAGCSQSAPTPTPERTAEAEGKVAAQQQAPQKAQPHKQRAGAAVVPQPEQKVAEQGAEAQAAPAEEGCGCNNECDGEKVEAAKDANTREAIVLGNAPVMGPANAPVTLVVFSDFACPFCARAVDTLQVLETRYGDDLRIAFKNRPLPMHERAPALARAALAAHEQGRFWEFHDVLFDAARLHDAVDVERTAQKLGLDLRRFRADLADSRLAAQVDADNAEAERLEVRGTPTFFVNGRRITGAQPASVFRDLIDEELRAAGRPVPTAK